MTLLPGRAALYPGSQGESLQGARVLGRKQDEATPGHAADAGADLVGGIGPGLTAALAGDLRNRLMLPATSRIPRRTARAPQDRPTEVP